MKLRIRTKLIGILAIAAVLPLVVALLVAQTLSYRSYRTTQGLLLETRARELARSLSLLVNSQVARLHDWIALSNLRALAVAREASAPVVGEDEFKAVIEQTEGQWSALAADQEPLRGILQSEVSAELQAFRMLNPLFAEVLATNTRGELIGATAKSSDFWQADEVWWQSAMHEKFRRAFLEGINYDTSAGVYSLDVAVPIRDWQHPVDPPLGVVKGVVVASPLLASFGPALAGDEAVYQVVLADGRILAQLSGEKIKPLEERITPATIQHFERLRSGWMAESVRGGTIDLAGYAPLTLAHRHGDEMGLTGLTPMYVIVYLPASQALAPVRRQILLLSLSGVVLILGCVGAGYWLAGRQILAPLDALRAATQAISASAKLGEGPPAPAVPLPALEPIRRIKTGDELEELAHDFAYMGGRVLSYHQQLERDLAAKTAEIERDLQMAREFQQALLPQEYPVLTSTAQLAAIALEFHHIYRPASSVGGDFFDVLKLSDHRAGIFIADVMGHGARSALVTAILRALLHNLATGADDPALFLARLNQHFHEIVRENPETIFVSAFYLVIDTETATATYASAGHPSPFLANRTTQKIAPLIENLKSNPALGLLPVASYSKWSRAIHPGDVFLLFTDGLHEAYNASGEEFGLGRVRQTMSEHLPNGHRELTQAIVEALGAFIHPAVPADDLCLVTVEVTAANARPARPAAAVKI